MRKAGRGVASGISSFFFVALAVACGSSSSGGGATTIDAGPGGSDGGPTSTTDGSMPATDGSIPDGSTTSDGGVGFLSGTRLRANVIVAGNAKLFDSWHDSQASVDCNYGVAHDGKTRCLPKDRGDTLYDGMGCTTPVGRLVSGGALPKYFGEPLHAFVCGKGTDFFAIGAAYTPTALYRFDGSSCTPDTDPADATATFYHFGAEIPPSTFAEATEQMESRGTDVGALVWVGLDGSREDETLLDFTRKSEPCSIGDTRDGKTHYCVPRRLAYLENQWADIGCSMPAAYYPGYVDTTCSVTPTAIMDSRMGGLELTLFEVGAKLTTVYEGTPAACNVVNPDASLDASFYAPAASIANASLPPITEKQEGAGRIQLTIGRTSSGAYGDTIGFYDTTKMTPCIDSVYGDDMRHCVPETGLVANSFADSACTQAVVQWPKTVPSPTGKFVVTTTTKPNQNVAFQIGATVAVPAMLWELNGYDCVLLGTVDPQYDYYGTTPIPASDLATVTTMTQ